MQNKTSGATPAVQELVDIRNMTDAQFLSLGLPRLVYVRRDSQLGQEMFAIYAANGELMGTTEDSEMVRSAIDEHALVATLLH
ncbi:hypothetical protein AA0242T_1193 [Acetobacter aceti NRIC 0242]|uniref:DUF1150 domain-containing protein n=1 Tax=Acetobacter aceti NBRC 14818 TaxID=887700 RepID=A0AB33IBU1_ACEAC|nr:hypothetical protein [Acetobacter aceti]TCS34198.1 hypothetical protein EDC15_104142 [Acetobacter aceti NBRC 14818]BCK75516.1 hypothetical protein EMQ_1122 [Acetobacter aceti NBRC 14818]GAN56721.1 hypothetical protein Abac_009_134 [Acetobacter aceti NBRC 14818]GBO80491.1 hypothetical protein AA0242T_1193 [Acetobacter aceti NRIC 0242]